MIVNKKILGACVRNSAVNAFQLSKKTDASVGW